MFLNTEPPNSRKFPLFGHRDESSNSSCSQLPSLYDSAISLDIPYNDFDLAKQNYVYLQSRDTLEAVVQSALDTNKNNSIRREEGLRSPCRSMPQAEDCSLQQDSSAADNCHQVIISTNCETIHKVWDPQQVQSHGKMLFPSSNASSERAAMTKKNRIRWTRDLNKKFIECVNCLGGAKKATPKGILKLMSRARDGLTISHVKSHLQNYRVTQYIHGCEEGNSEILSQSTPLPDPKLQIIEALRLQIDIQERLSEQLEIQTTLQLRIEEQAKQLKQMLNHQKKK